MQVWKLVHIVVRWALLVVAEHDGGTSLRLPVLSELQLGRFMSRSDATTCLDLAMDIIKSMPGHDQYSEETLTKVILDMRAASAASDCRKTRGYSRDTDSVVVARRVLDAVERQVRLANDQQMFWCCCRTTTWVGATRMLPGRDWQSVRDDFRKFALILWQAEIIEISAATDQMSRILEERRKKGRAS